MGKKYLYFSLAPSLIFSLLGIAFAVKGYYGIGGIYVLVAIGATIVAVRCYRDLSK